MKQRDGEERDEKREMEFGDSMRGHDDELGLDSICMYVSECCRTHARR